MQQRQLRLGDILDDYCTRERRLTNHAIVAMVGEEIRQTRCTTCDWEHPYKGGRLPPQRKKKAAAPSLYEQVLTSVTEGGVGPAEGPTLVASPPSAPPEPPAPAAESVPGLAASETPPADEPAASGPGPQEEGRVHRALIRATLPRLEGQLPARPAPEFTVRQPGTRHGRFEGQGGGRHQDHHKGRGSSDRGAGLRGPGSRPGAPRAGRPGHPAHHQAGPRPVQHQHPSRRPPGHGRMGKKPSK